MTTPFSQQDEYWMMRALALAELGLYTTRPNPKVGCVLVKDNHNIGEGWHYRAGEQHAEIAALAAAGANAIDSCAYVTLEPCSFTGRTPPCTNALIQAGVRRVVIAMSDPYKSVNGEGIRQLQLAGMQVECGLLEAQAKALNPGFIRRSVSGMPFVRCKMAMSLDGRTAMASGQTCWITGKDARKDVQKWRAQSCAIITGIDTVLHDDCLLTIRPDELDVDGSEQICQKQPLRVILDSTLKISPSARILNANGRAIIVTCNPDKIRQDSFKSHNVDVVELPGDNGHIHLPSVLNLMCEYKCNEVLIESGSTLAGAFITAGLVDQAIVYMAPTLMGSRARPLFELPFDDVNDKISVSISNISHIGKDLRFIIDFSTKERSH